ncbi:helix-turn-helix domain-containing protein [Tenacibaculum sp. A30]|uniref:AraC family transcriptional regulator n=1 Tax=Tenacibaculum sp. A30 TaxID=3442644 RepID=UPI003EBEC00C
MKERIIEYQLAQPKDFFAELSKILPVEIKETELVFKEELGEGKIKYIEVQEGLWAQQIDYTLHEDIGLFRIPKSTNDFFLVDFYLSDTEIIRCAEGKTFKQSFENVNMVLSSSTTASKALLPKNKRIKAFNILISKEWLFKNVLDDHDSLRGFFNCNSPIYLSENLDYKLKELLKKIDLNQNNRLTSISNIIQIVDYLFIRFGDRPLKEGKQNIHPNDLQQLMKVRKVLDTNPEKEILLNDLSGIAGMSLSKFKRLFKQVLGTTPYKYHLKNKMEKAMETLQQGNYSVSETGFLMGYSNLSQFSKAFKNHFGILPSEVSI